MSGRPSSEIRVSPEAARLLADAQAKLARQVSSGVFDNYVKSLALVQQQYARAFTSLGFEQLQRLSRQVAAIRLPDYTLQIQRALATWQDSIRPLLDQVAVAAERLGPQLEALAKYPDAMAMFGWPALEDLDIRDVYWVVAQSDAGAVQSGAEVDRRIIVSVPDEQILKTLAAWERSTLLARQAPILREAIRAHLAGKYTLSVPVLLLCVESVAATLVRPRNGRLGKKERAALIAQAFRDDASNGNLERAMLRAVAMLFNDMLYGRWFHGDPMPLCLNRHAVLHGGDLDYGTQANSPRVILLLDLLQKQYRYFALASSDVFHTTGCPTVRRLTAPAKHYLDHEDAHRDGRRPCRVCLAALQLQTKEPTSSSSSSSSSSSTTSRDVGRPEE